MDRGGVTEATLRSRGSPGSTTISIESLIDAIKGRPLFSRRRDLGAPILDSDIKVRKNAPGVRSTHKYTATVKGEGVYGFGNTPAEARAKFRELKERFERETAERRSREGPLYSRATAATLPGILNNGNVPRVREWFAPKLDALRVKLQDRFLMLKRHQEAEVGFVEPEGVKAHTWGPYGNRASESRAAPR